MDDLSGGAQASVLLSLVLQTDDSQPLIIDQPEDELDKDYLLDIFLPALRKLKGRRQIVFATHDANIVVNGDADQVIYLTADHQSGHVNEEGTIDKEDVRDAILNTLDGGADAFSLRQTKYGF
jgi:ABC-type cobalamin/Fe3+-siderophores transport system ATPase subunit